MESNLQKRNKAQQLMSERKYELTIVACKQGIEAVKQMKAALKLSKIYK